MAGFMHDATALAYVLHVGGGTVGLLSGTIAAFAKKGKRLHRRMGALFFASMLVMAVFAGYLALVVPGQLSNLLGATTTFYLLVTAWLTVRRKEGTIGMTEKVSLMAIIFLVVAMVALKVAGAIPAALSGPLSIALYTVGAIMVIAAVGDLRIVVAGGITGAARIARHLWRMLTALTFAFGSAFTNGLPRLLPGPFHVTPIFFAPMLLPLALLVFWMVRVRFTGWFGRNAAAMLNEAPSAIKQLG